MICACAFLSCTDTEDFSSSDIASSKIEFSDEELASIALDNPRTLDEEEVLQMVLDFSHSVNRNTRSASSPQLSIELKFLIQDKKDMLLFLQTKETQVLSPMFQMENSRIVMKQVQE